MSINKGLFSSKRQDWVTPKCLYNELDQEFGFDFDPCPLNPSFDGLSIEWGKVNFVNPPYKESKKWIKKAFGENLKAKVCVLLLPARTDTLAFHEFIYKKHEIRFLKGRLNFDDSGKPAPFPSMVVVMR
jgi:hypothetical protein